MKYIFLNLKRFDIPVELGGVNSIAQPGSWASYIMDEVKDKLADYKDRAEFTAFFPEAHILPAIEHGNGLISIGCQGVHRKDVAKGGNFGAFTTLRTAQSMKALGCDYTIIGHCEERSSLEELAQKFGGNSEAVNDILNQEILCAQTAGLKVLYCVGEKADEHDSLKQVLGAQLREGLKGVALDNVLIAYEPLWAIGPGRPVPSGEEIGAVSRYIKSVVSRPVVYGGGLKESNARMIADIPEIDGGLIALTRFGGDIGFYPDEYLNIIQLYMQ